MSKIKIVGDAAVVTSTILLEDLKTLKKYKPNALKLINSETKEEIFSAAIGDKASFSKYGIVFTGADGEGKATATLTLPTGMTDEKKIEYVKDTYGYGLLNLKSLEDQIKSVMDTTAGEFAAMANSIEIL